MNCIFRCGIFVISMSGSNQSARAGKAGQGQVKVEKVNQGEIRTLLRIFYLNLKPGEWFELCSLENSILSNQVNARKKSLSGSSSGSPAELKPKWEKVFSLNPDNWWNSLRTRYEITQMRWNLFRIIYKNGTNQVMPAVRRNSTVARKRWMKGMMGKESGGEKEKREKNCRIFF